MKVKIIVPETLADLKLSQYQEFIKNTKDIEDDNYVKRQLVSIFLNIPIEKVNHISKKDYDGLVVLLSNLLAQKPELKTTIKHDGVNYGFIPNLEDITVGEQADIDAYINDVNKWDQMMAIMYRPIKMRKSNKYLIEDYTAKEPPLDLPLDVVFGAVFFFTNLLTDLLNCTQNFIKEQVDNDKSLQTLVESGVGIKTFTHSLEETFLKLTMSLN